MFFNSSFTLSYCRSHIPGEHSLYFQNISNNLTLLCSLQTRLCPVHLHTSLKLNCPVPLVAVWLLSLWTAAHRSVMSTGTMRWCTDLYHSYIGGAGARMWPAGRVGWSRCAEASCRSPSCPAGPNRLLSTRRSRHHTRWTLWRCPTAGPLT